MKRIIGFIAIIVIFISCSSSGSNGNEYVGTWHRTNDQDYFLIITELSKGQYLVEQRKSVEKTATDPLGWSGAVHEKNNFSYQNGTLVGPFNVSIVFSNDKLQYDGHEYVK